MEKNQNTKLLYAVGIGLLLSDLIPTPADAVYFSYMRNNKEQLTDQKITPKQYWTRDALGYYGFNAVWWLGVLGLSSAMGKNYYQKRNIMLGLIAGGVVFSVLRKNIKKDEEYYEKKNAQQ